MSERRFRRGETVQFQVGTRMVQGQITEDRGPIGVKGRRLYRIRFDDNSDGGPWFVELPAVQLQTVDQTNSAK